eukprot:TRINITY_DN51172_c0_g1_i1.p1 TRINITY_DN51172_c0_g1~~TRINITY_DN51172_c0_g1_i1.p1  ORF type:complete len:100 (-),score=28.19 TRINITY_DN51172_c0_g1_i1:414-713(-)
MQFYKAFLVLFIVVTLQPWTTSAMFGDMPDDDLEDETSFMQVSVGKPVARPRQTGPTAAAKEPEDEEEEFDGAALFQSSVKVTGVNERKEELETDEFSM